MKVIIYDFFGLADVTGTVVDEGPPTWTIDLGNGTLFKCSREQFKIVPLPRADCLPFSIRQVASLAYGRSATDIKPILELIDFLGEPLRPVEAHDAYSSKLKAAYGWLHQIDATSNRTFERTIEKVEELGIIQLVSREYLERVMP